MNSRQQQLVHNEKIFPPLLTQYSEFELLLIHINLIAL
jgi:hypothetical protein